MKPETDRIYHNVDYPHKLPVLWHGFLSDGTEVAPMTDILTKLMMVFTLQSALPPDKLAAYEKEVHLIGESFHAVLVHYKPGDNWIDNFDNWKKDQAAA